MQVNVQARVEQSREHGQRRVLQAVAREPGRDERVVVRPDRAVVVRHRVVARFAGRERADAPAGEARSDDSSVRRPAAPRVRPRDAGEQRHGRRSTRARARRFSPSSASAYVPSRSDSRTRSSKRARSASAFADHVGRRVPARPAARASQRRAAPRGVDVALDLAERDRPLGEPAVGVKDRVVRVLPALMHEAVRRLARVLDEAVAVEVAVALDPVERGAECRPEALDERRGRRCARSTRRPA